jgi:hypothetical protein
LTAPDPLAAGATAIISVTVTKAPLACASDLTPRTASTIMQRVMSASFPETQPERTVARRSVLRYAALFVCALLVLWLAFVGTNLVRLWFHARAVQAVLSAGPALGQAPVLCDNGRGAADALAGVDLGLRPLRPLLPHLGWVPRVGPELTQASALLDAGVAAGDAGRAVCAAAEPVLAGLREKPDAALGDLLPYAAPALAAAEPHLAELDAALGRVETALGRVDFVRLEAGVLAPAVPRMQEAAQLLPQARTTLALARELGPVAESIVRPGPPRRYVLVAQNSAELRATGGFVGTLGTIVVSHNGIELETFGDSYDLHQEAPDDILFPVSYLRYLRISEYYARDFNWNADFPTSVETLRYFWLLNKRPPFDGVIAFDLYTLPAVLHVLGPIDIVGFGQIESENAFEQLFALYETRDKQMIARLLEASIARVRDLSPQQALELVAVATSILDERHVLVALDDPAAHAVLARRHWDGAQVPGDGDYLMVAESDYGFAEVGFFIDTRITYSVTLTNDLVPITATVRLDVGNEFDQWRQARTRQLVLGHCLQQELPGCYGNFVRIYSPATARGMFGDGFDSQAEIARTDGTSMFGSYLLNVMGELRSASLHLAPWVAPAQENVYHLYVQKQSGTLARPLQVKLRTMSGDELTIDTDLRVDREFEVGWRNGRLALLNELTPIHPRNAPERLARREAFVRGWKLWEAGEEVAARATWRSGDAVEYVIDRANMLAWRQRYDEAIRVARVAVDLDPSSPRATFALGYVLMIANYPHDALAPLQRSLALDPSNTATQFALREARRLVGEP